MKRYLVETELTVKDWITAPDEEAAIDMAYDKYENQDIYDDISPEVIDVDYNDFLEEE